MNRRLITASALLACCLAGCAANKDFEKEILGHPAPEQPSDTGWSRQPSPPPPPPPPPPPAQARPTPPAPYYAPAPVVPPPATAGPAGATRTNAPPLVEPAPAVTDPRFAPKPFAPGTAEQPEQPGQTQGPGAQTSPPVAPSVAAQQPLPASPATPGRAEEATAAAGAPSDRAAFTFMVGSFAHSEKAGELMTTLEARGFSTRMDQGKLNNKTFFKVFAVKDGNRAELEGELFAAGVTEPRLVAEQPVDSAIPLKTPGKAAAKVSPAAATPAPNASSTKPSGKYAPPKVEPAPPLPDGYVPPPPKASGS